MNKELLPSVRAGITVKLLHLTIVERAYTAFSYDIGFSANYNDHSIALSVKDIEKPLLNDRVAMTGIIKYEYRYESLAVSVKYVSVSSLYDHWLLGFDYMINNTVAFSYAFRLKNGEHRTGLRFNQGRCFINIGYTFPAELDGYLFSEAGVTW